MIQKLKNINWKDLTLRAVKTFIQTFISYLTIDGLFGISDKVEMQRWLLTTGLSALAAAISAVWNLILGVISDKAGEALDKINDESKEEEPEVETEETEEDLVVGSAS